MLKIFRTNWRCLKIISLEILKRELLYAKISSTTVLVQSWKLLYGWQNGGRQHYITLPGSTESYGEHTLTCTFENHGNLPANLTNWLLTGTVHSEERLSKRYKKPRRPFSKLCSNLLCAYCFNNLPERGPIKAQLRVLSIMPQRAWAQWRSAYAEPSLYPLRHSRD